MRTKTFLRTLIVGLCFVALLVSSVVFAMPTSVAEADTAVVTQKSLIGKTTNVSLTENATAEGEGIEGMDVGKSGLLIESTKTGSAANGSGFTFAKNMRGKFSMEFRVLTDETFRYESNGDSVGNGVNYDNLKINPFADVKQLDITIADKTAGKEFVINIISGTKYNRCTPIAAVKTRDMVEAKGIKYRDSWADNIQANVNRLSSNYTTQLIGSSFMAYANSTIGTDETHAQFGVGGIPTKIEFDPATGEVFGYGLAKAGSSVVLEKRVILNLSDPSHVGSGNEIKKNEIQNYSVSVKFTTVIPNDYSVTLNENTDNEVVYPARTRYAKMLLYSINGQSVVGTNDGNGNYVLTDTQGAVGYINSMVYEKEENALSLKSYDFFEGEGEYDEDLSYYIIDKFGNKSETKTITKADGYKITPEKIGTLYITVPGEEDSEGNVGEEMQYEIQIRSKNKLTLAPSDTMQKRNVFDISAILNSTQNPYIYPTDIQITNYDGRDYNVKTRVSTPDGKTHSLNVIALPYNVLGTYVAEYIVTDEFGHQAFYIREFVITDTEAPVLVMKDNNPVITLGDDFNLAPYFIGDNYDDAVSYICQVYKGENLVATLNGGIYTPTEAGDYKLVYTATDGHDNETVKEIKLTVAPKTQITAGDNGLTPFIVIGVTLSVLIIAGGVVLFILANKKKGGQ